MHVFKFCFQSDCYVAGSPKTKKAKKDEEDEEDDEEEDEEEDDDEENGEGEDEEDDEEGEEDEWNIRWGGRCKRRFDWIGPMWTDVR